MGPSPLAGMLLGAGGGGGTPKQPPCGFGWVWWLLRLPDIRCCCPECWALALACSMVAGQSDTGRFSELAAGLDMSAIHMYPEGRGGIARQRCSHQALVLHPPAFAGLVLRVGGTASGGHESACQAAR
jgi:hypothetical protein